MFASCREKLGVLQMGPRRWAFVGESWTEETGIRTENAMRLCRSLLSRGF